MLWQLTQAFFLPSDAETWDNCCLNANTDLCNDMTMKADFWWGSSFNIYLLPLIKGFLRPQSASSIYSTIIPFGSVITCIYLSLFKHSWDWGALPLPAVSAAICPPSLHSHNILCSKVLDFSFLCNLDTWQPWINPALDGVSLHQLSHYLCHLGKWHQSFCHLIAFSCEMHLLVAVDCSITIALCLQSYRKPYTFSINERSWHNPPQEKKVKLKWIIVSVQQSKFKILLHSWSTVFMWLCQEQQPQVVY